MSKTRKSRWKPFSNSRSSRRAGFTLIEMLISSAIIIIISSVITTRFTVARNKGHDNATIAQAETIRLRANLFYANNRSYTNMWASSEILNLWNQMLSMQDNTLTRAYYSDASSYLGYMLLKNGSVVCIDAIKLKIEPSSATIPTTPPYICP